MPSIVGEALNKFGTEAQKQRYLKPLLAGDTWAAEALTEPRGGSDFFGATCTARLEGNHFILNGHKRFIVGAKGADFFLVYCRTNFDPQAHKYSRISLLLVERDMGVEVGSLYGLLGSRGTGTGRVVFKDVKVPRENLIGGLHEGALIFNTMMVPERFGSVAAIGMARAALEVAVRYTDKRVAFGQKIRKWQGVSFQVADAVTKLDAARGLYYIAASHLDAGLDSRRLVSEAKHFATDINWQVSNIAMVIMGGISYTDVYPVEKFVRDARLGQIWTGTENVMRMLIQHEYYNELLSRGDQFRAIEQDATNTLGMDEFEKVFADEDQKKLDTLSPIV
jgi:acyl-CoA dehydrogenase